MITKSLAHFCLLITVLLITDLVEAQQTKVFRVGVIHQGGPYKAVVNGLQDGLRQLGLEEGKQFSAECPGFEGRFESGRGGGEGF